jgi:hypothetical protein
MKKKLVLSISSILFSCVNLFANESLKERVKTLEMLSETTVLINNTERKNEKNYLEILKIEKDLISVNESSEEKKKGEKNEKIK